MGQPCLHPKGVIETPVSPNVWDLLHACTLYVKQKQILHGDQTSRCQKKNLQGRPQMLTRNLFTVV